MDEAETVDRVGGAEGDGDCLVVVSADRSDAEKREAYTVEWREPANKQSLADRVRNWL